MNFVAATTNVFTRCQEATEDEMKLEAIHGPEFQKTQTTHTHRLCRAVLKVNNNPNNGCRKKLI